MSKKTTHKTPSLRHHKATGQGFVELDGRRVYLGRFDRPDTRERYHRLIAEWLANGRQLPVDPHTITVAELIALFWKHAENHYRRPDGSFTSERDNVRLALRPVRELYGSATARDFGPRALKAIRQVMVEHGWCRLSVNRAVGRVRRMFKWGVENETVPPDVFHALAAVSGLTRGRSEARESEPATCARCNGGRHTGSYDA